MKLKVKRRWGWKSIFNNRGAIEGEEGNPIEDALNHQLSDDSVLEDDITKKEGTEKPPEGEEKQGEEGKKATDKKEESIIEADGYKGPDRRSGRYSGEERRKDVLDKLQNIDLDFDYGSGDSKTRKLSIKEAKDTLKWLQDNINPISAGLSINKYSKQFPEFGKLMSSIMTGAFSEDNKFNPDFAAKILKVVESKEEVIEEKEDEIDSEIEKIEKALNDEEIDPDSPQAEVLRSSLVSLKAMKGRLGTALSKLDEVSKKFEGFETAQKKAQDQSKSEAYQEEVKRIAGIFSEELRTLTDKEKEGGYKFVDDLEMEDFEKLVKAGVGNTVANLKLNQGESVTDEQFKKFISESAKAAFDKIVKRREAIEQSYIKRKGLKPKKEEIEENPPESDEDMNIDDLTGLVEGMLPKS